eukprot:3534796-Pleurochrysis_carterae.AAC.3
MNESVYSVSKASTTRGLPAVCCLAGEPGPGGLRRVEWSCLSFGVSSLWATMIVFHVDSSVSRSGCSPQALLLCL